ncbi:MAG: RHS repeat-associated core domain-containing protein [Leptospirales bacterium]
MDTGKTVSRTEYLPYRETFAQEGDIKFAPKYNGQALDEESDLYYYNARHYDPEIGRFVTADSVTDGPGTIKGWNRYMYVGGNPIMYKDPTGHVSADDFETKNINTVLGDSALANGAVPLTKDKTDSTGKVKKEFRNYKADLPGSKLDENNKLTMEETLNAYKEGKWDKNGYNTHTGDLSKKPFQFLAVKTIEVEENGKKIQKKQLFLVTVTKVKEEVNDIGSTNNGGRKLYGTIAPIDKDGNVGKAEVLKSKDGKEGLYVYREGIDVNGDFSKDRENLEVVIGPKTKRIRDRDMAVEIAEEMADQK